MSKKGKKYFKLFAILLTVGIIFQGSNYVVKAIAEGGGGIKGDILFDFSSGEDSTISFDSNTREYLVPTPGLESGTITLPTLVNDLDLGEFDFSFSLLNEDNDPFLYQITTNSLSSADKDIYLNNFSISESTFTFQSKIKRFTIIGTLEDTPDTYYFTFYDPEYESMEMTFKIYNSSNQLINTTVVGSFNDIAGAAFTNTANYTIAARDDTKSKIVATANIPTTPTVTNVDLMGGVWEYVVDRSDYVSTTDSDNSLEISLTDNFGKTNIHFQYLIGYSWEGAMITIAESDYMGLTVTPQISVGNWGSGIVDISNVEEDKMGPTAYVGYVRAGNRYIYIKPDSIGRSFTIESIESEYVEVEGTKDMGLYGPEEGTYRISLPESLVSNYISINILEEGEIETKAIPLYIKKVLIHVESVDFVGGEPLKAGDELMVGPINSYIYKGYEDFVTILSIYSPNPYEWELFEQWNYNIVVMYYKDNQILGTKQVALSAPRELNDEWLDRDEKIIYIEGDPEYQKLAQANRITAFVVDSSITASDDEYQGTLFGLGEGWGHLMPNHSLYGEGKDGMILNDVPN